jgi:orotidine-5'-phosphate decarboxylase
MNFADTIQSRIEKTGSALVAGIDPRPATIPRCFLSSTDLDSGNVEKICRGIVDFYTFTIVEIASGVAAAKPNLAFFEQYGASGIEAYLTICQALRAAGVPIIADAKRGDIGSTAAAYASAFLKNAAPSLQADALTVNPFLGFDTLEPFVKACRQHGTGIFVLVKTSNPGSHDIQNVICRKTGLKISEKVALWIGDRAEELTGKSGYSSLGAVVGATYPGEAKAMRNRMPNSLFLIPGLGAQGGTAKDAVAGFDEHDKGGIINVSRGLFSSFSDTSIDQATCRKEISRILAGFNGAVAEALG